jgi:hypothetical protein
LKTVAKAAIPLAGKALGTFVGGPLGGMIGGKLGDAATKIFGLEIEGLSGEDQSFEVARRVVRFGADAVQRAGASAAAGQSSPQALAQAVRGAAKAHAPGLLRPASGTSTGQNNMANARAGAGTGNTGRWIRRGNHLIVFGV